MIPGHRVSPTTLQRDSKTTRPEADLLLRKALVTQFSTLPSEITFSISLAPSHPRPPRRTLPPKQPQAFHCGLCSKRYTNAYNLRSHLRTHTDERPFVCTVCGKAFARQHDRKRHEGLHSSEKKFACKGDLASGQVWGCGRRFARADALGRHFRSEAGRVCVKPLLDEEAAARHSQTLDQTHAQPLGLPLPHALLAQYPALNQIDWSAIAPGYDSEEI